jgi:CheY-like chemotaxis protein
MAGENILVVENNATLLRVVESALMRGEFQVASAGDHESSMALARSAGPALILIDSGASQPTNSAAGPASPYTEVAEGGVGLCRALVADAALADIPVVLMVPRGENVDTHDSRTPNVVDYITKPFSPDALLTMVEQVIGKRSTAPPTRTRTTSKTSMSATATINATVTATEAPTTVESPGDVPGSTQLPAAPRPGLSGLRAAIGERLQRHSQRAKLGDAARLLDLVASALPDAVLVDLLTAHGFAAQPSQPSQPSLPDPDVGAAMDALAGRLGAVSVSEVLSLLSQQSQTGTLRITLEGAQVDLFFRVGRIELAAAVGVAEEFLLGRFVVDAGYLSAQGLATVLRERGQSPGKPPLFGRDLLARGLITPEQLKTTMRRQTAEIIYECLRWSAGRFQFRNDDALPELATDAALAISVDSLLLEGLRRVDEWRLIERDIHSFDLVFVREDLRIAALAPGTLTREEIAVLDALNGKHTVREVVRVLRMGSFDVTSILYRLRRAQLIRQRVDAIASH